MKDWGDQTGSLQVLKVCVGELEYMWYVCMHMLGIQACALGMQYR